MHSKKLKIGILLDGDHISHINADLIDKLYASKDIDLKCFLITKYNNWDFDTKNSIFKRISWIIKNKKIFFYLTKFIAARIHGIESRIFFGKPLKDVSIDKYNYSEKLEITTSISKSGLVNSFASSEIEKIESLGLDLLIRCGEKILRGEVLTICPFGVISFHHGDNDFYRGSPSTFYETYYKEPYTSFIIQKLSSELDNGDVFVKGDIKTSKFHSINARNLHLKGNLSMLNFLEQLSNTRKLPDILDKAPYSSRLYKMPSIKIILSYSLRSIKNLSKIAIKKITGFITGEKKSAIGFIINNDWKKISLWKASTITPKAGVKLSNPSPFKFNDSNYCMVNSYEKIKDENQIRLYQLFDKSSKNLGKILIGGINHKNPFIFEANNHLHALIMNDKERSIEIYICNSFPSDWSYVCTPQSEVTSESCYLFQSSDKSYWIISSTQDSFGNKLLNLYKSNVLDRNGWLNCSQLRSEFMESGAINAGYIDDKTLHYRLANFQIHENENKLNLYKIDCLEPAYKEFPTNIALHPRFREDITHINSFSYRSGISVFDFEYK